MKLWIMSDLHIDVADYQVTPTEADIVILAGDIAEGLRGIEWAHENLPKLPVLYVPGNHEYYGFKLSELNADLKKSSSHYVQALQRDSLIIEGVRFLGCTLWTDFGLFGDEKQDVSMFLAKRYMADFRKILLEDKASASVFSPEDSVRLHQADRRWLEQELAKPFEGKTIVITHHAPHLGSLHPRFADDLLSAGFLSDLTHLMGKADLWIHGHIHDSFDYQVNGTRVVCNPRGYVSRGRVENEQFSDCLVIDTAKL